MTPKDLEAALEAELGEQVEEAHYYDYYDEFTGLNGFYHLLAGTGGSATNFVKDKVEHTHDTVTVPNLGKFTRVDKESAYDEQGDLDERLVFEYNGQTFCKEGALDSWEGGVWDGSLYEVKQVEKTIKVWEKA